MNKDILPKKTKIIAWIMITIGGMGLIGGLFATIFGSGVYEFGMVYFFVGILTFVSSLFLFLPGTFLLKRKKWAWKVAIGILILGVTVVLGIVIHGIFASMHREAVDIGDLLFIIFISPFLIPLILLFLDRKNYWKIAS